MYFKDSALAKASIIQVVNVPRMLKILFVMMEITMLAVIGTVELAAGIMSKPIFALYVPA